MNFLNFGGNCFLKLYIKTGFSINIYLLSYNLAKCISYKRLLADSLGFLYTKSYYLQVDIVSVLSISVFVFVLPVSMVTVFDTILNRRGKNRQTFLACTTLQTKSF